MAQITHKRISETAAAIGREAYESLAHDNVFFAEWPNLEAFVQANWQMFMRNARDMLMQMLTSDDYPDSMKDEIYDALVIDGGLKQNAELAEARRLHRIN